MAIRVEFYGIARQWAGIANLCLDMPVAHTTLGKLIDRVGHAVPNLGDSQIARQGVLHESLVANLDGDRFISDPDTPIRDGQCLLILSADAGG
jgi:molybdopterin converting factor small subunit